MGTKDLAPPPEAIITPSSDKQYEGGWWRYGLLGIGALIFLFPFYYMVVGSFQTKADKSVRGILPEAGNVTVNNYIQINESINIPQGLLNSTVFTIGVLLCTLIFGLLAGWSLALLEFRGKSSVFNGMLLLLVVSFQLLLVPLYVLIVRYYGLADSYLGMILPFAINSTAVFIFRQFFLQIPKDLFEAARIDGASELLLLWKIGIPMARPAILSAALITFIGPWNEFMWPFLITKEQELQPFAVSLSNYMTNIAGRADNPDGSELAGGVVLALPVVLLFVIFQKHFTSTDASSGVKG
jgi:multiple sugar transport system permease protein